MADQALPTAQSFWMRWLAAIAEAVFANEERALESERVSWLISEIDDFTRRAGSRARNIVILSTIGVFVLAPIVARRLRPITRMRVSERVRVLDRLERTSVSAPLVALKALLSIIYYEEPRAQRDVGFDASCLLPKA